MIASIERNYGDSSSGGGIRDDGDAVLGSKNPRGRRHVGLAVRVLGGEVGALGEVLRREPDHQTRLVPRPSLASRAGRLLLTGIDAQATEVEGEHEQVERPDHPVAPVRRRAAPAVRSADAEDRSSRSGSLRSARLGERHLLAVELRRDPPRLVGRRSQLHDAEL